MTLVLNVTLVSNFNWQKAENVKKDQALLKDSPKISQHNIKILLVEDNKINQKVVMMMLDKMGYHCDTADNGQKAIGMCKSKHYDLILMDILMPILDGISATQQIRENELEHHTHIIAMTAKASDKHKQECFEAGVDDFLSKPVSLKELTFIIDSLEYKDDIAS